MRNKTIASWKRQRNSFENEQGKAKDFTVKLIFKTL
jgi:hypothetical protein